MEPVGRVWKTHIPDRLGKSISVDEHLSYVTGNPFVFQTCQGLMLVFVSGIFFFLFLRELDLHPISCCAVAFGFSTSTLIVYWLSFSVFLATFCWTLALFWLITRFIKSSTVWGWIGLVFAAYSLFMTEYPQSIILSLYLLGLYSLVRIRKLPAASGRTLFFLSMAFFAAFLVTLPVYLDIFIAAKNSARLKVADSFFVGVLPRIRSLLDLGKFMLLFFDPYLLGNPVSSNYPVPYNGISLTPIYFILLLMSFFMNVRRKLWGWHLFIAGCFITTLWPAAYLVLVHYFGFSLSRIQTLGIALIPCFIVSAYVIDSLLTSEQASLSVRKGSY